MHQDAEYWINNLGLTPHVEGGYFRKTYCSQETVNPEGLPNRYSSARAFSTAIYFLLEGSQVSKFHRLRSNELWLYHAGSALTLYVIDPNGTLHKILLGTDVDKGEQPQIVIQHGVWFGAKINQECSYTLVSCVVVPGFDFEDFELATSEQLLAEYPQHREIIELLT